MPAGSDGRGGERRLRGESVGNAKSKVPAGLHKPTSLRTVPWGGGREKSEVEVEVMGDKGRRKVTGELIKKTAKKERPTTPYCQVKTAAKKEEK